MAEEDLDAAAVAAYLEGYRRPRHHQVPEREPVPSVKAQYGD